MSALLKRTITVLILIPVVFSLILLLPWLHHLAVNLACIVVSILGAYELSRLFAARGIPTHGKLFPLVGGLLPLLTYLRIAGLLPAGLLVPIGMVVVGAILAAEAFVPSADEFPAILPRIGASLSVLIYPGLFLSYIIKFSTLRYAGLSLVLFLVIVFANDILAYLVGSFFGKGSRGFLAVSPNKSTAGFIGGMAGSVVFAYLSWILFPHVFSNRIGVALAVGLGVGALTIIGDLIESAMKRSGSIKDSGNLVPGRGGILDSIDSILFACPLCFYILILAGGAG